MDKDTAQNKNTIRIAVILGIIVVVLLAIFVAKPLIENQIEANRTSAIYKKCNNHTLNIVVSINQWSKLTEDLVGDCGNVTTILNGTDVDPHEYEPTADDISKIQNADLVVINGGGYDQWANTRSDSDSVFSITEQAIASGFVETQSENPHVWFSIDVLRETISGLSLKLVQNLGETDSVNELIDANKEKAYNDYSHVTAAIDEFKNKNSTSGKTYKYVASESVADYLADQMGMENVTPQGYQNAAANESEPSPSDLAQTLQILKDNKADVLLYNAQEEDEITKQLREAATAAGIPVVVVTEQIPEEYQSNLFDYIYALAGEISRAVDK
jgi:zinc/manganese transport system substrate-binding protein